MREKNFVNYTMFTLLYSPFGVKILIVIRADGNEEEIVTSSEIKEVIFICLSFLTWNCKNQQYKA